MLAAILKDGIDQSRYSSQLTGLAFLKQQSISARAETIIPAHSADPRLKCISMVFPVGMISINEGEIKKGPTAPSHCQFG